MSLAVRGLYFNLHAMRAFKDYIAKNTFLREEEIDRILRVSVSRKIAWPQHLLKEWCFGKWHVFVAEGCLRTYYHDWNDKEQTIGFSVPGTWTGDRERMEGCTPSRFNIDAVQDSVVMLIADADFQQLCKNLTGFNTLADNMLINNFRQCQKRIYMAVGYSADKKYAAFRKDYPAIADRIPKYMIASYLGITFEHFSRSKMGRQNTKG